MGPVRKMRAAGAFYPAAPQELGELFATAPGARECGAVRALILPHAGYVFSLGVALAAVAAARGCRYRRIVVLAPSHITPLRGCAVSSFDRWETPFGELPVDAPGRDTLANAPGFALDDRAQDREHAIEVQLPLVKAFWPETEILPVTVGELDGEALEEAAAALKHFFEPETLFLISSDFTHYGPRFGYTPFGPDAAAAIEYIDPVAADFVAAGDRKKFEYFLEETSATICGAAPIRVLLRLFEDAPGIRGELAARDNSCALAGRSDGVGYASFFFSAM